MIEYRKRITREMMRAEPSALFVFGDNLQRRGLGGQAKEMRGEPNAVGIPTKRSPSMADNAFLTDKDYREWRAASKSDFVRLIRHNGLIVWPADGIGTGLARLEQKAPKIWHYIAAFRDYLDKPERTVGVGK